MADQTSPGNSGEPVPYFDDPCATFKRLRSAYEELVSGEKVARTEYHGNGQERHLEFSLGSVARLEEYMKAAYDACQQSLGQPPARGRRFAIRGGSVRTRR